MADIQKTLADNLKYHRKQAGLTQEQLAEKCGLHRTYIGGIEQERINISLKNIGRIAAALDIDPTLLFVHNPEAAEPYLLPKKARPESMPNAHQVLNSGKGLKKGGYGLFSWTEEGITVEPISVQDESLSYSILCSLIADGRTENLAQAYEETQRELIRMYREIRKANKKQQPGS